MRYRKPWRLIVSIMLVGVLVGSAGANDQYVKSPSPLYLQVTPDRALVYFARLGRTASLKHADGMYIDARPVALLPKNSYAAVTVEPGLRFVWWTVFGALDGDFFDFKPGRTYVLRAASGSGVWYLDDPATIQELVERSGLNHVTTTDAGLAGLAWASLRKYTRLRNRGWQRLQEARKEPGRESDTLLPVSFGDVAYRPRLGGFKEPGYWRNFGELSVDRTSIRWKSHRVQLEIPVTEIQRVAFGGLSWREHAAWVEVRYRAADGSRRAFFHSPTNFGFLSSYNRKFVALSEAIAAHRS